MKNILRAGILLFVYTNFVCTKRCIYKMPGPAGKVVYPSETRSTPAPAFYLKSDDATTDCIYIKNIAMKNFVMNFRNISLENTVLKIKTIKRSPNSEWKVFRSISRNSREKKVSLRGVRYVKIVVPKGAVSFNLEYEMRQPPVIKCPALLKPISIIRCTKGDSLGSKCNLACEDGSKLNEILNKKFAPKFTASCRKTGHRAATWQPLLNKTLCRQGRRIKKECKKPFDFCVPNPGYEGEHTKPFSTVPATSTPSRPKARRRKYRRRTTTPVTSTLSTIEAAATRLDDLDLPIPTLATTKVIESQNGRLTIPYNITSTASKASTTENPRPSTILSEKQENQTLTEISTKFAEQKSSWAESRPETSISTVGEVTSRSSATKPSFTTPIESSTKPPSVVTSAVSEKTTTIEPSKSPLSSPTGSPTNYLLEGRLSTQSSPVAQTVLEEHAKVSSGTSVESVPESKSSRDRAVTVAPNRGSERPVTLDTLEGARGETEESESDDTDEVRSTTVASQVEVSSRVTATGSTTRLATRRLGETSFSNVSKGSTAARTGPVSTAETTLGPTTAKTPTSTTLQSPETTIKQSTSSPRTTKTTIKTTKRPNSPSVTDLSESTTVKKKINVSAIGNRVSNVRYIPGTRASNETVKTTIRSNKVRPTNSVKKDAVTSGRSGDLSTTKTTIMNHFFRLVRPVSTPKKIETHFKTPVIRYIPKATPTKPRLPPKIDIASFFVLVKPSSAMGGADTTKTTPMTTPFKGDTPTTNTSLSEPESPENQPQIIISTPLSLKYCKRFCKLDPDTLKYKQSCGEFKPAGRKDFCIVCRYSPSKPCKKYAHFL